MATFREGKLARKRNGRFQSKAGKSRTEKFLDSRKRKSSDGLANTIKLSLQSECESETVLSGRRVVELGLLSKELADGCKYCKSPLQLSNCWKETVSGLGSFLYITCREDSCGEINVCHTSKVHRVSDRGRPVFDVNTKLAAGMLHAGIGATHVNALLTSVNLPAVHENTLKAREREIGPALEKIAKRSCKNAIEKEKSQWLKESSSKESPEKVGIGASYDTGWQKRGKGHNSFTGVGTMIGLKSGKVIAYGTRTKRCAVCGAASRKGEKPRSHDCRLNWSGSSKAMEPDIGVELSLECSSKHNAEVKILVGDDDSATIKRVKEQVAHHVEKWSDINHAKKSFTSHLYAIQSQFKGQLSAKVIEYFSKCFGYALVQNRNNTEGLKKNLKAIVPHAFGKHDQHCSISWCGFLKDPLSFRHSSLPHGKDLHGEKLEEELEKVMANFVKNADKLAPLGSSQANESLNNTIGSKAPKIRHYGASESNDFRVACAVSQKNIGHTYVSEVIMPKFVSWQQYMALMSLMSTSFPLMEFHPVQQLSTSCQLKTDIFFMMGGQLLLFNSMLQLAGSWIGCRALNDHAFYLHIMQSCLTPSIFKELWKSPTRSHGFKNSFLAFVIPCQHSRKYFPTESLIVRKIWLRISFRPHTVPTMH
ncbi:uncharacterized protein LOC114976984 [Acropora millepora]|uniref:uncharacterized protein LOC114976984 n=1 Tax=Acropora millepora TaxID=45264 RepID=UPI001CF38E8A|nr:uncharacterized protein LOC114976984 [Acropora millepora]